MITGADSITETAAGVLAAIERNDNGELAEVDEVFVIAAVHYGAVGDEEGAEAETVYYRCTSARLHVQLGLLAQARRAIEREQRRRDEGQE